MAVFILPSLVNKEKQLAEIKLAADSETGIGGVTIQESDFALEIYDEEIDFDLSGVPEPALYSRPLMLAFTSYNVIQGDTISDIALWAGLNEDTLLSVNNIRNSRLLQINQTLRIPNQDGIYYTVTGGDTLTSIGEKYETSQEAIVTANELFSSSVAAGSTLFIPGARMDWVNRQEINGDLFVWPVSGYISSLYGWRNNPFGGGREFHTGLDIAAPTGTPVRAAMAGRVSTVSFNATYGHYIVITHHSGYRTLYAHLSVVRVRTGAYVNTNERIGDVGSTGLSTGPHVHFTVYKNGITVNPRTLMR